MPEHFVLFWPKDVVSGDFYWIREAHGSLVVVVADCTGHGVPGAFMSMLGISLLDEQLGKPRLDTPGRILDNLRSKVKEMLVQSGEAGEQKDGMDMAVVILDKERKVLQFAGANSPLYLIRRSGTGGTGPGLEATLNYNGLRLYEFRGDRQPIGLYWEEQIFTTHRVALQDQDSLYLFTDGYIDQFGGENRKRYKSRRFRELLLSIQHEPMEVQKQLLEQAHKKWRGENEQIDDICVVGFRI
jgi:serine phosphatase RsbU (regulator of sigma subunit)